MKKINWLVVSAISVIVLVFLFGGGMTLAPGASAGVAGGWAHRGWGMMGGPGGMMGGWSYSPFGWIGMALMWLIPLGVVALIAFGVAALVKNVGNPTSPVSQTPCPNCGKATQADWQNCPFCGRALK